jgi:translation initiation factor 1
MAKKQNKIGVVYSTNPDFEYMYEEEELVETLPPSQQTLKIQLDKKQRAGKQVTLINNFIGTQEDLKELCKELKAKCGVGGRCSEGEILLQGDHRDKVSAYLQDKGYRVKRVGG